MSQDTPFPLFTPPGHTRFSAMVVASRLDKQIADCAVAYIEPSGGGPEPAHTHVNDHLFVMLEGEATIVSGEREIGLKTYESVFIPGNEPHSVWNESGFPAKIMKVNLVPRSMGE